MRCSSKGVRLSQGAVQKAFVSSGLADLEAALSLNPPSSVPAQPEGGHPPTPRPASGATAPATAATAPAAVAPGGRGTSGHLEPAAAAAAAEAEAEAAAAAAAASVTPGTAWQVSSPAAGLSAKTRTSSGITGAVLAAVRGAEQATAGGFGQGTMSQRTQASQQQPMWNLVAQNDEELFSEAGPTNTAATLAGAGMHRNLSHAALSHAGMLSGGGGAVMGAEGSPAFTGPSQQLFSPHAGTAAMGSHSPHPASHMFMGSPPAAGVGMAGIMTAGRGAGTTPPAGIGVGGAFGSPPMGTQTILSAGSPMGGLYSPEVGGSILTGSGTPAGLFSGRAAGGLMDSMRGSGGSLGTMGSGTPLQIGGPGAATPAAPSHAAPSPHGRHAAHGGRSPGGWGHGRAAHHQGGAGAGAGAKGTPGGRGGAGAGAGAAGAGAGGAGQAAPQPPPSVSIE